MKKIFLGMSGGVDSSVSAILLKEQGYDVTGIYMKNWSEDLPGMKCPWAEDLADAKRVAVQLDLDFEVWDFEADYKQRVVDYMLAEFQKGRTPNPDVMCNEQIKFKLFYERALAHGADYIATGHYARVGSELERDSDVVSSFSEDVLHRIDGDKCVGGAKGGSLPSSLGSSRPTGSERSEPCSFREKRELALISEEAPTGRFSEGKSEQAARNESRRRPGEEDANIFFRGDTRESERSEDGPARTGLEKNGKIPPLALSTQTLCRAKDENKDQTYFLYRMSDAATAHTLFPIGNLTKPEVKQIAKEHGLDVATKKESMGVCFVGEVGMKDFLREYLDAQAGEIREIETNKLLGYHDGAIFYTIGQRHGLYLGGGLPYYVVQKDLTENIVYVSRNLNHEALWTTSLELEDLHLRNGLTLADIAQLPDLTVRLRHRAPLVPVKLTERAKLSFASHIKRPASGQSAVLYSGKTCLGGGIIA